MSVAANLDRVRQRIADACARAGRAPSQVTLIAVSKSFPFDSIVEAAACGHRQFGENRVQEGLIKIEQIEQSAQLEAEIDIHLIGHLQRNKARHAGKFASVPICR